MELLLLTLTFLLNMIFTGINKGLGNNCIALCTAFVSGMIFSLIIIKLI